ncbi:MAG: prenyltransferase [Candidatus Aminicenantes bacterium]|nr:prenyltransferase [Candidatus Aminicenantes bacterium]
MKKSKAIMLLLRLPFLVVTAGAVFIGTAFALWETNQFNLGLFLLAFFGACFLHISCNVANDYFDFKSGNDASNQNALVPFSGGSRMVLDGFVKPKEAMAVSIFFAVLGSAIGFYLNIVLEGNYILFIGLAALFFVFSYNGFPVRLVNKGWGEVAIFLAWGPLMVLGAYYVQANSFPSPWVLIVAVPSGVLTTLVLLINEFADKDADFSTGRKTWVILFGFKRSLLIYLLMALSCYLVVLIGVFFGGWPLWSLLVMVTLPMPFMAYRVGKKNLENWPGFLPAVKNTILMNFVFLVILSVSFVV